MRGGIYRARVYAHSVSIALQEQIKLEACGCGGKSCQLSGLCEGAETRIWASGECFIAQHYSDSLCTSCGGRIWASGECFIAQHYSDSLCTSCACAARSKPEVSVRTLVPSSNTRWAANHTRQRAGAQPRPRSPSPGADNSHIRLYQTPGLSMHHGTLTYSCTRTGASTRSAAISDHINNELLVHCAPTRTDARKCIAMTHTTPVV